MPFGGLGFGEMVLIFAVLLLLFGAKRLPELAGGMGKGIRDFKRALNGLDDESVKQNNVAASQPAPQVPPATTQTEAAPAPQAEQKQV